MCFRRHTLPWKERKPSINVAANHYVPVENATWSCLSQVPRLMGAMPIRYGAVVAQLLGGLAAAFAIIEVLDGRTERGLQAMEASTQSKFDKLDAKMDAKFDALSKDLREMQAQVTRERRSLEPALLGERT